MKKIKCPTCKGKHKIECKYCDGMGKTRGLMGALFGDDWKKCSGCNGRKKVTCDECGGKGWVEA